MNVFLQGDRAMLTYTLAQGCRQSHAHIHSCSRLYNGSNEAMRSKGDGSQSVDLSCL